MSDSEFALSIMLLPFYPALFSLWVVVQSPREATDEEKVLLKEEIADFVDAARGAGEDDDDVKIHQANLPLPADKKIQWGGSYKERGRYFASNYSLVFQQDGTFEGRGSDADGSFEVKFGRLNPTNGRMGWYEAGSVHTVVTGTYELSPSGNVKFVRLLPPGPALCVYWSRAQTLCCAGRAASTTAKARASEIRFR